MKCKNCGIHFEDDERECPMCGTPAGRGNRIYVPRFTDEAHTEHGRKDCTHRTFTREVSFTGRKRSRASSSSTDEQKKKVRNIVIGVVVVILLLQFVPLILQIVENIVWEFRNEYEYRIDIDDEWGENAPVPDVEDDFDWRSTAAYDVLGEINTVTLSDGTQMDLRLEPGEYGMYQLIFTSAQGTMSEMGESWCCYIPPEESWGDERFPTDQYSCYALALTPDPDSILYDEEFEPPMQYALRQDETDLWFLVYLEDATGICYLMDMDGIGIFGDTDAVQMSRLSEG